MGANATALSAELFDNEIVGFSIDSRTTGAGELFFALSQEDYARAGFNGTFADAHRFIPQAFKSGAIAAVARADRVRDDAEVQAMSDRLLLADARDSPPLQDHAARCRRRIAGRTSSSRTLGHD